MTLEEAQEAVVNLVAWSAEAFPGANADDLRELHREFIKLDVRAETCVITMERG